MPEPLATTTEPASLRTHEAYDQCVLRTTGVVLADVVDERNRLRKQENAHRKKHAKLMATISRLEASAATPGAPRWGRLARSLFHRLPRPVQDGLRRLRRTVLRRPGT